MSPCPWMKRRNMVGGLYAHHADIFRHTILHLGCPCQVAMDHADIVLVLFHGFYQLRWPNVLYLDFELSEKQFQLRYTDEYGKPYTFPERLYRVSLVP